MRLSLNRTERITDQYPFGGRLPIVLAHPERDGLPEEGKNHWALLDYLRPIGQLCQFKCAYCGLDGQSAFWAFLAGSAEHVVSRVAIQMGIDSRWVLNDSNTVWACNACNSTVANVRAVREFLESVDPPEFPGEFLQKHVDDPDFLLASGEFEPFMRIRDEVFDLKKQFIEKRRAARLQEFEGLRSGRSSGNAKADRRWRLASRTKHNCAICGRHLAECLDTWSQATEEHLVPKIAIANLRYPAELVLSDRNTVVSCRMCNTFANDGEVRSLLATLPLPIDEFDFDEHIECMLEAKRDLVRKKLLRYRSFYNRRVRLRG